MLPPDRLADLPPQEASATPEQPDFPSVALLTNLLRGKGAP
jgi:hypothetical protein